MCFRIDFKIILLVLNGFNPKYLSDLLLVYEPPRAIRSLGAGLLFIPKAWTKTYGEASFIFYGPFMVLFIVNSLLKFIFFLVSYVKTSFVIFCLCFINLFIIYSLNTSIF